MLQSNNSQKPPCYELFRELFDRMNCRIAVYAVANQGVEPWDYELCYSNTIPHANETKPGAGLCDCVCEPTDIPGIFSLLKQAYASGESVVLRDIKFQEASRQIWYKIHIIPLSEGFVAVQMEDVSEHVRNRQKMEFHNTAGKLINQISRAALRAHRIKTLVDDCILSILHATHAKSGAYFSYNADLNRATILNASANERAFLRLSQGPIELKNAPHLVDILHAGAARVYLESKELSVLFDIDSFNCAVLPVTEGKAVHGFFLFIANQIDESAKELVETLKILSAVINQAIVRIHSIQQVIDNEAKLRSGFDYAITSKSISTFPDGVFINVNQNFCDVTGYAREELIGSSYFERGLWANPDERLKVHELVITQGFTSNFEASLRRKDGRLCTCLLNASLSQIGDDFFVMTDIIDITERKKAETELFETKQLFETALEGTEGLLAVRDRNGRFVYVNAAYAKVKGRTAEDYKGRYLEDVFSPKEVAQYILEDRRVIETLTSETYEETIASPDGQDRYYLMRKNPIYLGYEKTPHVCIFALDITTQKQTELALQMSHERYRKLFDIMLNGFSLTEIICDEEGNPINYRFLEINPALERMMEIKAEDLIGKTVLEVWPDTELHVIQAFGKVGLTGEEMYIEDYNSDLDKYFSLLAFCPQKGQCAVLSTDITERKRMENALFSEKEQLRITLTSIGDGVITTDKNGRIELLNDVAQELTGWRNDQAVGKKLEEVFDIFSEVTGRKTVNPIEKVLKHGRIMALANHTALRSLNGTVKSIADSAAPIKDPAGNVLGAVLVFRDVTTEKRRNEKIAYLSYHDTLTGLFNRNYLDERLAELSVISPVPIAVIMGDVNGLKLTNDIFGHKEGDHLLRVISNILRSNCRADDILVRWAGDEFLMVLPNTSLETVSQICKKISDACDRFDYIGHKIVAPPSISLGFAVMEESGEDIMQAVKAAEDFMYKRKLLEGRSAHSAIITSLKKSLFEKSNETEEHAVRLTEMCCKIGAKMGLSASELDDLHLFALLHDIGKIAINDNILNKPDKLNDSEWEEMKRHPEIGYRIAQCTAEFRSISEYILTHHERWDGEGYTQGLKGEQIPLLSRILSVVDAFDAMMTNRPYRDAMPLDAVKAELKRCSGTQFDPRVVSVFLDQVLPEMEK